MTQKTLRHPAKAVLELGRGRGNSHVVDAKTPKKGDSLQLSQSLDYIGIPGGLALVSGQVYWGLTKHWA
jgi:hypothetical protein